MATWCKTASREMRSGTPRPLSTALGCGSGLLDRRGTLRFPGGWRARNEPAADGPSTGSGPRNASGGSPAGIRCSRRRQLALHGPCSLGFSVAARRRLARALSTDVSAQCGEGPQEQLGSSTTDSPVKPQHSLHRRQVGQRYGSSAGPDTHRRQLLLSGTAESPRRVTVGASSQPTAGSESVRIATKMSPARR
jgi:hypothetical protein